MGYIRDLARNIGAQLREHGILTTLDLQSTNPANAKVGWSVVLEKPEREQGCTSCIKLEDEPHIPVRFF